MKKILEVSYDKIINRWGLDNKGKGVVTCVPPLDYIELIVNLLKRMTAKNNKIKILIVVDDISKRSLILNAVKNENLVYQTLSIITFSYIVSKWKYHYDIVIAQGKNEWCSEIETIFANAQFKLMLLNKINIPIEQLGKIYKNLPAVNTIDATDVKNLINITPVKEEDIAVEFANDELRETYDKYSNYISDTIQIFGNFDNIEYARQGKGNISAKSFIEQIAYDNGWSDHLDMTIPFNAEIDNAFNPTILEQRAHTCYDIIRERSKLATDNDEKLKTIIDILEKIEARNKKVIICSKRGEFAYKISEYVTANWSSKYFTFCGNYHDCIPNMKLLDDYGRPVTYKTGLKKGAIKIVGTKYISTDNLKRFNIFTSGKIDILSIKNSSSNKLACAIDAIIFTSPSMTFEDFKNRFPDVVPNSSEIQIFTLYTAKTIEEKEINKIRSTFK